MTGIDLNIDPNRLGQQPEGQIRENESNTTFEADINYGLNYGSKEARFAAAFASAGVGTGGGTSAATITTGVNASDAAIGIGAPADAAGDPSVIGLLKQIDSNTANIEVTLDAGNISIDNVDTNTDELEALAIANLQGDGFHNGTVTLANKASQVANSAASDTGIAQAGPCFISSFYSTNNGNTIEHWLGIIADSAVPAGGETLVAAFKIGAQAEFAILIDESSMVNYGASANGYRLVRSSTPLTYTAANLNGDNYISATFNVA